MDKVMTGRCKISSSKHLWDHHNGVPEFVAVEFPDGSIEKHLYRIVTSYDIPMDDSKEALKSLRYGAFTMNKCVYPIAQTVEGYIVAAYSYDNMRFGMFILNVCGLPYFEREE